jgi:Mrp family chromosome partitioning ATPase
MSKCNIIAVTNSKGSAEKPLNLEAALTAEGRRVLLLDNAPRET